MELLSELITLINNFIQIMLHLDIHLNEWVNQFGMGIYAILFLIIFCETGLVVTPFLPGDSLLFAMGAIASIDGSILNIHAIVALLIIAGILGDAANYSIGKYFGPKIFFSDTSFIFSKKHLDKTHDFYKKYGIKTIVLARFLPIIRTLAPFVAGLGRMQYKQFALYNVIGALLWVSAFSYAGYFFGNISAVKRNFHIVIFGIIFVSALPAVFEFFKMRKAAKSPNNN
jgi:membrane-associated protein